MTVPLIVMLCVLLAVPLAWLFFYVLPFALAGGR